MSVDIRRYNMDTTSRLCSSIACTFFLFLGCRTSHREKEENIDTDKTCAESIAKQYAPKSASKLTALKKLDAKAKRPANVFAYSFGIASSLLLGVGMCLTMGVLGPGEGTLFVLGIVLGILGIAGASVNLVLYRWILETSKKKYAFEIMELAKGIAGE